MRITFAAQGKLGALVDVFLEWSLEGGKHHGLAQMHHGSTMAQKTCGQCLCGHDVFVQQNHGLPS